MKRGGGRGKAVSSERIEMWKSSKKEVNEVVNYV